MWAENTLLLEPAAFQDGGSGSRGEGGYLIPSIHLGLPLSASNLDKLIKTLPLTWVTPRLFKAFTVSDQNMVFPFLEALLQMIEIRAYQDE